VKILFLINKYSALSDSLSTGEWAPKGMPAIVKLFEKLTWYKIAFDVIFIDKVETNYSNNLTKLSFSKFPGSNFYLANKTYKVNSRRVINVINKYVFEIKMTIKMRSVLSHGNYDLVYVDRENIIQAALLSAFHRMKVVLRLHGVSYNYLKFNTLKSRLSRLLEFLCFKAKFSFIICSKDGSPVTPFLNKFTSRSTPSLSLLNGIDKPKDISNNRVIEKYKINNNFPVILFVARLEKYKKIVEFVSVIHRLRKKNNQSDVFIIGDGSYSEYLKRELSNDKKTHIIGAIEHSEVAQYYQISDIFVSFNDLGNLCNTVLEAISYGCCIITFFPDQLEQTDFDTREILGSSALFVNKDTPVDATVRHIQKLSFDINLLEEYKRSTSNLGSDVLGTWADRIDVEIEILKKIAKGINTL